MIDREEISRAFACDHPDARIRRDRIGRSYYINQCLVCGLAVGGAISFAAVRAKSDGVEPASFDEALFQTYQKNEKCRYDEWRAEQQASQKEKRQKIVSILSEKRTVAEETPSSARTGTLSL
jgi:hypothetical protein